MVVPSQTAQVIRFGTFELDVPAGELRKNGSRVRIQEQPYQLLLVLLSHPVEVVSREELRRQLWPADTFVDFETGLNRSVAKLRELLGDSPDVPRYIRTVPRKGYRFIAAVETSSGAKTEAVASLPPRTPAKKPSRRTLFFIAVAAMALLATALYWGPRRFRRTSTSASRRTMLVVLPFENLTGNPEQEYFSDGMTEETITQLGQLQAKDLGLIARTSAMKYKHTSKGIAEIAQELHVDYIVEGSVRREDNRVRIAVQLIRASDQTHLWADTYDRQLADVLAVQKEIASAIGQQLELRLTDQAERQFTDARPGSVPEANLAAYEAYLRGRSYLIASSNTPQAIRRAQSYFREAIQLDPNFARAYSGLGECYVLLTEYRWLAPDQAYAPAIAALRKALALDNTIGEAHTALAWLAWRHDWDWRTAEEEFNYALRLNPNDVDAHQARAWYFAWKGQSQAAMADTARIHELDPAQVSELDQAGIFYHQRNYARLMEVGQKAVASRPDFWISHYFLGVGYEGSGRLQDAINEYQKAVELSQGDTDPTAGLAHAYAVAGRKADAERIVQQWLRTAKTSYVSPYMIATIYGGLGKKDKAFEFLEKAYQERSTDLPYFARADLRLDELRSDPRLPSLLRRLGLPQ